MKLLITTLAVTAAILLVTVLPAQAEVGTPPAAGCQPGADNNIVNEWKMFNHELFVQYLVNVFGYDEEAAVQRSKIMFNFCDHNGDGYVCVMQQNLPNDASGRSTYWLAEDNHPFGGQ